MRNLIFRVLLFFPIIIWGDLRAQALPLEAGQSSWLAGILCGGNLTSSNANTLGGWGHFSLGAKAALAHPSIMGTAVTAKGFSATFRTGVYSGLNLGPAMHGFGSVDLYLEAGGLFANGRISEDAGIWGTGARIGFLRNSIMTPAVSLSVGYHSLGKMALGSVASSQFPVSQKNDLSTLALRVDVSKNFFWFTPGAGIGLNRNSLTHSLDRAEFEVKETESVYYAGVELNFLIFRLGLELGRTGGETFGSLGLRVAN